MTDRLTDILLGLQRMAEGARMRADDLEYSLLEDRKRLMPVERVHHLPQDEAKIPRVVGKGPAA